MYPLGPEGAVGVAVLSGRLCDDIVELVREMLEGDIAGAAGVRVALGPVGALKAAGPRGGDFGGGERGRAGDLSRGVNFEDSRTGNWVDCAGDLSRL